MARAAHLEVKLPPHVKPTDETNDQLIKKFLKECSKESLLQYLAEKSAHSRRFEKRSDAERARRLHYKRNAKKDRKSTRLNSSHVSESRMPSSA